MNKIFILVFALFSIAFCDDWKSYKDAMSIQAKNNKPIMVEITSSHCGYCHRMDKIVFEDEDMRKWLEERFILVKLDSRDDNIPSMLDYEVTPTFFFIKGNKVIKKIPGSWGIDDFKSLTKDIK
jgi:thioredoxin-related protein